MSKEKRTENFDEAFDFSMNVCRAFFGLFFGVLLGTTTVLQGAWAGVVFYVAAVYSAIWLGVLLFNSKKRKDKDNEQRETD